MKLITDNSPAAKRALTKEIKELKVYLSDIEKLSLEAKRLDKNCIGYWHHGKYTSHWHVDNTRIEIEVKEKKRSLMNK